MDLTDSMKITILVVFLEMTSDYLLIYSNIIVVVFTWVKLQGLGQLVVVVLLLVMRCILPTGATFPAFNNVTIFLLYKFFGYFRNFQNF